MSRLAVPFSALGLLLAVSGLAYPVFESERGPIETLVPDGEALVVHVIDGDSIEVELADGSRYQVRYIAIDAPEIGHPTRGVDCFAEEAWARNEQLVLGATVYLEREESETDWLGRLLRHVWLGDQLVSAVLVEEGYVGAYPLSPDLREAPRLAVLEEEAWNAGLGLWGACEVPTALSDLDEEEILTVSAPTFTPAPPPTATPLPGPTAAPAPSATPEPTAGVCRAADINALRACLNNVKAENITRIEILGLISCNQSIVCELKIQNVSTPLTVEAPANTVAGFRRTSKYDYSILRIEDSSNITIRNLIFDDVRHSCDRRNDPCAQPVIVVSNSANVALNQVALYYPQQVGVSVAKANNLIVKNSKFIQPGLIGIWMSYVPEDSSPRYHIENNFFFRSGVEAVAVQGIASATNPNTLKDNLFQHTHALYTYDICGPLANEPCGGASISVYKSGHTVISGNVIRDNYIENNPPGYNLVADGMEISAQVDSLVIRGNDFHNMTGGGFGFSPPGPGGVPPDLGRRVTIQGNKFYSNGPGPAPSFAGDFMSGDEIFERFLDIAKIRAENCFSASCPPRVSMGRIYAEPNPCVISPGTTMCASTIHWFTNDVADVQVRVSAGNQSNLPFTGVSQQLNGSQSAPWITEPTRFDLYAEGVLLDSVLITAIQGI